MTTGRASFYLRVGYALLVGLGFGSQLGGYMAWAENAKTPEAGAAAVIGTIVVGLFMLRWTR